MGNILVKVLAEGKGIFVRQCLKEARVQCYESRLNKGDCVAKVDVFIRGDLSNVAACIATAVRLRAISKGVGLPPNPTAMNAAHHVATHGVSGHKSAAVMVVPQSGMKERARRRVSAPMSFVMRCT